MTSGGPDPVCIGLDLGTSGLKAVALAASGTILARASAGYPTHQPAAGAYEQDSSPWARPASRPGRPSPGRTPGPTTWAMSSASAAAPPSCTG
jgi:xylulokinase